MTDGRGAATKRACRTVCGAGGGAQGRERDQDAQGQQQGGGGQAAGGGAAGAGGEHGAQARLQRPAPGHWDGQRQGAGPAGQRLGDGEQVPGVVGRGDARRQNQVIAGPLGFGPQQPRRRPDQWVMPVKGADQPRPRLRRPVAAPDMGELMEQGNAQALGGPGVGRFRQQDDGAK